MSDYLWLIPALPLAGFLVNGLLGRPYYVPPGSSTPAGAQNELNYGFGFNMTDLENLVIYQGVDRYTSSANLRYRPMSWLSVNGTAGLGPQDHNNNQTAARHKLPIAEE